MNKRLLVSLTRTFLGFAFLLITLLASAQFSRAQWTTPDSNNNISNTNSGNVAIGTSNPQSLFHVYGSSGTVNVLIGNGINSESRLRLSYDFTADKSVINSYRGASGYKAFEIDGSSLSLNANSGGNVGIGTTSPDHRLQIVGGQIRVGSSNSVYVQYDTNRIDAYNNGSASTLYLSYNAGTTAINATGGNVGIGKDTPTVALDVVGDIKASGVIYAKYQDMAEWVPSSEQLSAGTVVVLDSTKSNQVTSSTVSYDTRVAGVVSEQPGIALGEKSDDKVLVATTGRVRVKVDASRSPIQIGDLLVTSDVPGMAMKSEPIMIGGRQIHAPGTLIRKTLEPLNKGTGTILALLSLQIKIEKET